MMNFKDIVQIKANDSLALAVLCQVGGVCRVDGRLLFG